MDIKSFFRQDGEVVTSRQNPFVKELCSLSEKKYRERLGLFRFDGLKLFEEAIFILREDAEKAGGYTAEDVIREAEMTAQEYLRSGGGKCSLGRRLLPVASGAAGMLAGAMIWMMMGW